MPVRKYKSVEDLPAPPARPPLDPETICSLTNSSFMPRVEGWGRLFTPGVHRYRSIEALGQARETATLERMRRVQNARS